MTLTSSAVYDVSPTPVVAIDSMANSYVCLWKQSDGLYYSYGEPGSFASPIAVSPGLSISGNENPSVTSFSSTTANAERLSST